MSPVSPLAAFPSDIRDAHARWIAQRDFSALDAVILAIIAYHRPHRAQFTNAVLPDSAHLVADLGYDSLALAEVVFFIEDLYQVSISNQDLKSLQTIADLRAYLRAKVPA